MKNDTRLQMDIIWKDEDTIELLVNDRTAWSGDCSVLDLLRHLEELDYVLIRGEHDGLQEYLEHIEKYPRVER